MKKILLFFYVLCSFISFASITSLADFAYTEDGKAYFYETKDMSVELLFFNQGQEFEKDSIKYKVISESTVEVIGYTVNIATEVVIPASVEGYKVAAIGDNAFYNCSRIVNVAISEGIESIGDSAFSGCTKLEKVAIPSTVVDIGVTPFIDTVSLKEFVVSSSNLYYDSSNKALIDLKAGILIQYPLGDTATEYVVPDNVITIAEKAFSLQESLKKVTLSSDTKTIDDKAFAQCSNLESIELLNVEEINNRVFSECKSLRSITIPKETFKIYPNAFSECKSLESIFVESGNVNSYYSIDGVLYGLTYSFDVSGNVAAILLYPPAKKDKEYKIDDNAVAIGDQAFWDANNIEKLIFPENLKYIDAGGITCCEKLKTVVVNDKLEVVGPCGFQTNHALEQIELGKSLKKLEAGAFSYCKNLKEITIPASCSIIGEDVFEGCFSLQNINIEAGNPNYSSINGVLYNSDATAMLMYPSAKTDSVFTVPSNVVEIAFGSFAGCNSICEFKVEAGNEHYYVKGGVLFNSDNVLHSYPLGKSGDSYIVPDTTEEIGKNAFYRSKIKKVVLNEGLTKIGDQAFGWCREFCEINFPSTLEHIGNMALFYTDKIEAVTIPANVVIIENQAFDYCASLDYITFLGEVPPEFDWMFCNNSAALRYVYVPYGTQTAYKEVLSNKLYRGAMIVEGTKVSLSDTKRQIDTISETVTVEDYEMVTEAKNSFVRLTNDEKQGITTNEIIKLDSAVGITNPQIVCETTINANTESENKNISYQKIKIYGLNLASGVETGEVEFNVTPKATEGKELARFGAKYSVGGVSQQPKSPLIVEFTISDELKKENLIVKHYSESGEFIEIIVPEISGNNLKFRAYSLSTFTLSSASAEFSADGLSVSVIPEKSVNSIFCIAGYSKEGKLVDFSLNSGTLEVGVKKTLSLDKTLEYDKIKAFYWDKTNIAPIIKEYEK